MKDLGHYLKPLDLSIVFIVGLLGGWLVLPAMQIVAQIVPGH